MSGEKKKEAGRGLCCGVELWLIYEANRDKRDKTGPGPYLLRYAQEASWREDHRRVSKSSTYCSRPSLELRRERPLSVPASIDTAAQKKRPPGEERQALLARKLDIAPSSASEH
jgi:hypothetical protein